MSTSLRNRRIFMGAGILVAVAIGLWLLFGGGRYVSTEDAYVKMDIVSLSAGVTGPLVNVPVHRNEWVKTGQLLAEVDPRPYTIAVEQAEAQLAQVRNQLLSEQADYAQEQTQLTQANRDVAFYRRELDRNLKLKRMSVSEAALDESRHNLQKAESSRDALSEQLKSLRAKLNGGPNQPIEQHPDYLAAKAALDKAEYDLGNTRIPAPFAGQLGGAVPLPGKVVVAGLPVLSLARKGSLWVEANLKETRITHVKVGDRATVKADAYPDVTWQAEVASLSPASGSEFALIPPQNASGNWVKVVQRIPVALHFLPGQEDKPPLRAGMSVEVTIDTRSQVSEATTGRQVKGEADSDASSG
jgi:membrane fusion protein (multidrug efflux system)